MSIGTGILLSAIFLGLVFLYTKSDNQKKWRKITLYLSVVILVVVLLFLVFLFVKDKIVPTAYNQSEPKNQLLGVVLGSSLDDVQFTHGKFKKKKDLNKFGYEEYTANEKPELWVKNGKVEALAYYCTNLTDTYKVKLHHINCFVDSETIRKHYKQINILCTPNDPTVRIYEVENGQIKFALTENKVEFLWVTNNTNFPQWPSWSTCK